MARLLGIAAFVLLLVPAPLAHAADCRFVLGFAGLAANIPQVGGCLDDEAHAQNGDALQHTTGGLLVWRKADNWTAFTDGARTWIAGPYGLVRRANTQRFSWESPVGAPGPLAVVLATFRAPDSPGVIPAPLPVAPALDARLSLDTAPAPGSASGPPTAYALLVQSDGGLPPNLLFSWLAGNVVDVSAGNFPALAVQTTQTADGWLLANVACAGNLARSLLTTPGGWLGCSLA